MNELELTNSNAAMVIRAISNDYRMKILSICHTKTLQSSLEHLLKIKASTISGHVRTLLTAGLVDIIIDKKNRKKRYVKAIYDTINIHILSPSAS